MRLAKQTDYAVRVLVECARGGDGLRTVEEVADKLRIPKPFLFKIVSQLASAGLTETVRGRGGGFRLGRPAAAITLADVVRVVESEFELTECFASGWADCPMLNACGMSTTLKEALDAFFAVLARHSIADLAQRHRPADARLAS